MHVQYRQCCYADGMQDIHLLGIHCVQILTKKMVVSVLQCMKRQQSNGKLYFVSPAMCRRRDGLT